MDANDTTKLPSSRDFVTDAVNDWRKAWANLHGDPPVNLHHYTAAVGVEGIIRNQRLYATHASYLNDATELAYAEEVIRHVLQEHADSASSEASGKFLRDWQNLLDDRSLEPGVYVTCFCTEENLLSQWRGYAGAVGGYAIGFPSQPWSETATSPVILRRIVYNEQEQERWIRDLIVPIVSGLDSLATEAGEDQANAAVPSYLNLCNEAISELRFCFKHPAFEEEREWRIVYRDGAVQHETTRLVHQFRVREGLVVPYVELELERTGDGPASRLPISSVMVGPTADPDLAIKSIFMLLRKHGYSDTSILTSDIPLRR